MAQLDLLSAPAHLPPIHGLVMADIASAPPLDPPESSLPSKASGAYKTISEVADELDVPQHVLRFWESHFPQVKPSRMRGSRRYYRPEDVNLLKTIKTLLYSKGYTIKGAKQVVRSGGAVTETPPSPAKEMPLAKAVVPVQTTPAAVPRKTGMEKKNVDTQSLVSELRVLKSMLTSLL